MIILNDDNLQFSFLKHVLINFSSRPITPYVRYFFSVKEFINSKNTLFNF